MHQVKEFLKSIENCQKNLGLLKNARIPEETSSWPKTMSERMVPQFLKLN